MHDHWQRNPMQLQILFGEELRNAYVQESTFMLQVYRYKNDSAEIIFFDINAEGLQCHY